MALHKLLRLEFRIDARQPLRTNIVSVESENVISVWGVKIGRCARGQAAQLENVAIRCRPACRVFSAQRLSAAAGPTATQERGLSRIQKRRRASLLRQLQTRTGFDSPLADRPWLQTGQAVREEQPIPPTAL